MSKSRPLRIEVVSRLQQLPLSPVRCQRLLERAALLAPPGRTPRAATHPRLPPTLTVLFAGDARMRSLNARYRGIDATTDVLSFPATTTADSCEHPEAPHLGDVAISIPAARRQALQRGHGITREVSILLLHGYLHLLGYDHEWDNGHMERLEQRLRRELGLAPRRQNT